MSRHILDEDQEITDINVVPLVDVMLVLLVIFMVTATYIVNQSINVQLPKASTGEEIIQKSMSFVLDKNSNLYLNGSKVTLDEVASFIRREKDDDKRHSLSALIAADVATPHGEVIRLIDTVRKSGVTDFAINVEAVDR